MRQSTDPVYMSKKSKLLLSQKELALVSQSSLWSIRRYPSIELKRRMKQIRNLRDKYRDLSQRQKRVRRSTESLRTIEKADIFEQILSLYQAQDEKKKIAAKAVQASLDKEQHYDIDGVSQKDGKISFPLIDEARKKSLFSRLSIEKTLR
jgi:hypothetical protein